MTIPTNIQGPPGTVFSLSCLCCDAGDGIESIEQAIAAGWRGVAYDDGYWWNYLGCCPDCAAEWFGTDLPPLGWEVEQGELFGIDTGKLNGQ